MSDFTTSDGIENSPSPATEAPSSAPAETTVEQSPIEADRAAWDAKFADQDEKTGVDTSTVKTAAAVEHNKAIEEALAAIRWTDGKEYKVPAVFKDVLTKAESLDRDYTHKTQRFSEERKEVETALKAEFERVMMHRQHVEEMTEAKTLQTRIEQYKDIDFAAWAAQDPAAAQKHQVIRNELNLRMQELNNGIQQKITQEEQDNKRQQYVSMQRAQQEIVKSIPNWGPDVAKQVTEFSANTLGIPMEVLNDLNQFPWAIRALHMAMGQHQALASAQPQNMPKPTPEPVPKVGGSAPSAKNPDHLSMSDWLKWRNGQVARARQSGSRVH